MEKKKYRPIPKSKKERIGQPTGLYDNERKEIMTGDVIHILGKDYKGPVMWNRHQDAYGVFMGLWYGNQDPYDPDCYGKFIAIPKDNGMRMVLSRV